MRYLGINKVNGNQINDDDHINQSISDVLLTPIGSRIMRRNYGSLLMDLIDQPKNPALTLKIMSACYMALLQWEPRIRLQSIAIINQEKGGVDVSLIGVKTNNQPFSFSVPVR